MKKPKRLPRETGPNHDTTTSSDSSITSSVELRHVEKNLYEAGLLQLAVEFPAKFASAPDGSLEKLFPGASPAILQKAVKLAQYTLKRPPTAHA